LERANKRILGPDLFFYFQFSKNDLFDVFRGSDFGFLVVLGVPNPCRGNLGCYFGVSLCFSLCYPKLGIPLTGRPCVFGGVLMFIFCAVLMSGPLFVRVCDFLLVQFCRLSDFGTFATLDPRPSTLGPRPSPSPLSPPFDPSASAACPSRRRLRLFSRNHFQHRF
jgi:hypothetical protein